MNVQYINVSNQKFALIPSDEFDEMQRRLAIAEKTKKKVTFPIEVAEMNTLRGYSLMKAWRVYKGKTQKEIATALGMTQGAFSQIEKSQTNQRATLEKVATVLEISVDQLTLED